MAQFLKYDSYQGIASAMPTKAQEKAALAAGAYDASAAKAGFQTALSRDA
jgi:hypothetical protein